MRYGLLWLLVLLAGWLLVSSHNLAASFEDVLTSPKGYEDQSERGKADFDDAAHSLERWRMLFIVTLIFLGEAVALAFVHAKNPAEIERLVWPWLLHWL
jgi:hypothetical protein